MSAVTSNTGGQQAEISHGSTVECRPTMRGRQSALKQIRRAAPIHAEKNSLTFKPVSHRSAALSDIHGIIRTRRIIPYTRNRNTANPERRPIALAGVPIDDDVGSGAVDNTVFASRTSTAARPVGRSVAVYTSGA